LANRNSFSRVTGIHGATTTQPNAGCLRTGTRFR
jgi:hypothetical protein